MPAILYFENSSVQDKHHWTVIQILEDAGFSKSEYNITDDCPSLFGIEFGLEEGSPVVDQLRALDGVGVEIGDDFAEMLRRCEENITFESPPPPVPDEPITDYHAL